MEYSHDTQRVKDVKGGLFPNGTSTSAFTGESSLTGRKKEVKSVTVGAPKEAGALQLLVAVGGIYGSL